MSGCQPYLDHEVTLFRGGVEGARVGARRQLQLIGLQGDEQSLLFTFNQPLRPFGAEGGVPPFRPRLRPSVEFSSVEYEGVAGVRVRFAKPLAFATPYAVEVPGGWRAASGMPFTGGWRRSWSTARPELVSAGAATSGPDSSRSRIVVPEGEPLRLSFNQPVVLGSLLSVLRWESLGERAASRLRVEPEAEEGRNRSRKFLLWPGRGDRGSFRLALEPGLKGVQGPLRGAGGRELLVEVGERPLRYLGPPAPSVDQAGAIRLIFSARIEPEELRRCLVCLPSGSSLPRIDASPDGARLSFDGRLPERLVLVSGLEGADGSRMTSELSLPLTERSPSRRPQILESAAVLIGDQQDYAPGALVRVGGFFTEPPEWFENRERSWRVCGPDGSIQQQKAVEDRPETSSVSLFEFRAPRKAGHYRAELLQEGQLLASRAFRVGTEAVDDESYQVAFEPVEDGFRASLGRKGSRRRKVGLRTLLRPHEDDLPPGWERTAGFTPSWRTLAVTEESSLILNRKGLGEGGELWVEAFDRDRPELVLARARQTVEPTGPRLQLIADPSQPGGARPVLFGWDGPAASPTAELLHRLSSHGPRTALRARVQLPGREELEACWERSSSESGSSEGSPLSLDSAEGMPGGERRLSAASSQGPALLMCGPELPVQAAAPLGFISRGERPDPPGEPLLPPGWPSWGRGQVWQLTSPLSQRSERLPEQAGRVRWEAVGRRNSGEIWRQQLVCEVRAGESWSAFAPSAARPGDSFQAGVRFESAPGAKGALGLTAQALSGPGLLSPSGFLSTASVLKGEGSSSLAFSYRLDDIASSTRKLAWQLGHEGELHRLQRELRRLRSEPVGRGEGRATLPSGWVRRLPVRGELPWRLELRPPVERGLSALVKVDGPRGSLGTVRLSAGQPPVVLQGSGPGTVTLSHAQGAACSYDLSRLEPDVGDLLPRGERFYLFRELCGETGTPAKTLKASAPGKIRLTLLAPDDLEGVSLRVPLPGGVRALWLEPWPGRQGTPEVVWRVRDGVLSFELPELEAGEHVWEIGLEVEAVGDYLWPTARGYLADGSLQALSGSSRFLSQP